MAAVIEQQRKVTTAPVAGRSPLVGMGRHLVFLTATAGTAITLVFVAMRAFEPGYQNRALHVAKETAAALVLLLVAALLFGRFRRTGRVVDLLGFAGVLVLAGKNLVFSVLSAILVEFSGGLTTWRTTGTGMLGAALLVAAVYAPEHRIKDRGRALKLTALACATALATLIVVADVFELPGAFNEDVPETANDLRYLGQDTALLIADIGATVLFLLAGWAYAQRAEREEDEFMVWLGIGATLLGMAYLNYALFPSAFTDFLYVGDLFRVVAVVALGIGTFRVIGTYQAASAQAAVLEERRRVARDLHDGVAQELAFISSQLHWLAAGGADAKASERIMESVQRALDESRAAISALARPAHDPIHAAIAHAAEDVATRLGAEVVLDIDQDVAVPAAWEESLPRIVREAVTNAIRHGHARTVTVSLRDDDGLLLSIADDGAGFMVEGPRSETSFGLISMRERAESLGGEFRLSSAPGHGTSVDVLLPAVRG